MTPIATSHAPSLDTRPAAPTTQPPSIARDLGNYLSGRVLLVLLGFATFPLITRMLSVSQYGVLSLTLRIVLLLTVLGKCGLQYSAARFYHEAVADGSATARQRFHSTLIFGPLLTTTAALAVYLPVVLLLRDRLHSNALFACLLLAPALVLLRTLQSMLLSLLRNQGRSRLHSMLEVATRLLTLACLLALLTARLHSAVLLLGAITLSESLVVLAQLAMLLQHRLLRPSALDARLIRASLAFGAPLIAYELSSIVLDSGDRLLIRHFLGDTSLGYYSAAYNISGYLQDSVMTPLNLAIFPIYMRLWSEQGRAATQRFLSSGLSWFLVASLAITALSLLCSRDAIVLLASSRFAAAHRLLPILIPSLMLYATHIFLNVGLILKKRTGTLSAIVTGAALLNLLLNLWLIPSLGLTGAAWATFAAYFVMVGILAGVNQRILPLRVQLGLVTQAAVAAALAYLPSAQIHTAWSALTLALRIAAFTLLFALALAALSSPFRSYAMGVLAPLPRRFHLHPASCNQATRP